MENILADLNKIQTRISLYLQTNYDGSNWGDNTPYQHLSELESCIDSHLYDIEQLIRG